MNFEEQVKDLKVFTVTEPRTFIEWVNTEKGRDKHNCYERISSYGNTFYVNKNGKTHIINKNDDFFKILENMYNNFNK
jgi:hypothetical protein